MAVLTAAGINFSDSTALNSRYGILPQNSRNLFYSASAPPGWTQVVDHNDKAIRIVEGTGAGSGGTISFSSAFPNAGAKPISSTFGVTISLGAGGNFLSDGSLVAATQFPPHTHPNNDGNATTAAPTPTSGGSTAGTPSPGSTGPNGSNISHSHPVGYTSATATWSTSIDVRVQYIDVIICNFT